MLCDKSFNIFPCTFPNRLEGSAIDDFDLYTQVFDLCTVSKSEIIYSLSEYYCISI